ncbi:MAG: hypothetical protein ACFFD4_24880 [Candidatus Odinarchaeota archaeon]
MNCSIIGIPYETKRHSYLNQCTTHQYARSAFRLLEPRNLWDPDGKKNILGDVKLNEIAHHYWYLEDGPLQLINNGNMHADLWHA